MAQKQTETGRAAGLEASQWQEPDSVGVCSTLEPSLSSLSDSAAGWRGKAARGRRGALGHHRGHGQCGGCAGHGPCLRGHALLWLRV